MSLVTLKHARRSAYPASAKLHGGSLALAGGMRGQQGGSWFGDAAKGIVNFGTKLAGRVMAGKGMHRMRGAGFWSNLGSSFTNLFNNTKNFLGKPSVVNRNNILV